MAQHVLPYNLTRVQILSFIAELDTTKSKNIFIQISYCNNLYDKLFVFINYTKVVKIIHIFII